MSLRKILINVFGFILGAFALSAVLVFVCFKTGFGTKEFLTPNTYVKLAPVLNVWNSGCTELFSRSDYLRKAVFIDFAYPWQQATDETVVIADEIAAEYGNDYERANAVYRWVTQNIAYDKDYETAGDFTKRLSVSDALDNRYAVCSDFSYLTAALLRSMGIPAKIVVGYVGVGDIPHVWNEAYIDGRWITIDTTWDAVGEKAGGILYPQKYKAEQRYFDIPHDEFYENRVMVTCSNSLFEVLLIVMAVIVIGLVVLIIANIIDAAVDKYILLPKKTIVL